LAVTPARRATQNRMNWRFRNNVEKLLLVMR
jgi:hypothetical protein